MNLQDVVYLVIAFAVWWFLVAKVLPRFGFRS